LPVTVRVKLDGHQFDLEALAEHFSTGDARVVLADEGTFLVADLDHLMDDGERLVQAANLLLARVNGYAALADSGYRPVRLCNTFVRENHPNHEHAVVHDEARARDRFTVVQVGIAEVRCKALPVTALVDGVPVPPPPARAPVYVARAATDRDVADLLELVGNAEALGWDELWKALEIIKVRVGGKAALVTTGWVTADELDEFGYAANNPAASGTQARHARRPPGGTVPRRVMSIADGEQFIRDLARRWFDSL
jgi:hypothetical protein